MIFCRLPSLTTVLLCLCFCAPFVAVGQQPKPPAPTTQTPAPNKQNPFETVPESVEPAKPAAPGQAPVPPAFEAPKAAPAEPKPENLENTVEAIEFRGARRVPQDTLRALIFTKKGDKFDQDTMRRDFMALWNAGRFDDITLESEPGKVGMIIRFVLVER